MKKLVKILAALALLLISVAFARSQVRVQASDSDLCPIPGNNLIDNISPNVLVNLHKDAGSPNCWLAATFLFRTNDLASPNLAQFFRVAAENKILPIIRVASENSGDFWPAIDPILAASDAKALASISFPKLIVVELGNEINLTNEWGGHPDPASYADSFIAFANASSSNVKIILPPLSLSGPDPEGYYKNLYQSLLTKLPAALHCDPAADPCQTRVQSWLDDKIAGYALNLYASAGDHNSILVDKNRAVAAISAAGFKTTGKEFVITEIGLPGGIYTADVGRQACLFYQKLGVGLATIYSRDSQGRVHSFFFNAGCDSAKEYSLAVINLGGSVTYGQSSGFPKSTKTIYPPLGSLEECPSATAKPTGACSPVNQGSNICNSECSEPLEIDQGLTLLGNSSCLTAGGANCRAEIKIKGNTLPVPGQIKDLADYFEGTLDIEKTSPDTLQKLAFDEMFKKAGVARKLFPKEVQDDLRCKFIDYVKKTPSSKHKDLVIDGVKIRNMDCHPEKYPGWWEIPLFPSDDSLGKIEFVSPSLLTLNPLTVSLPEIQRLNLVTKEIQSLLVPAVQPGAPKTFGKAITFDSSSCQPTQTWENLYGADFDRAVACKTDSLTGVNNLKGCALLPDGTIGCQRTDGQTFVTNAGGGDQATVQVRTVFPHLFETSQQTISFLNGLLQIFRPGAQFSQNYEPIPAKVEDVKYELTGSSGLAINDTNHKEKGWDVYFYSIGGLVRARDFVLNLLNPPKQNSGPQ